jgi:tetratricopeptide (TPR) repeat protein
MTQPTVFISYSHKDEEWKDRLVTHLRVLEKQGQLDLWDDRRIGAGEDWHAEIQAAMARASVAVLLVSADFLTSDFILGKEVPRLLRRRDEEGLRVFPIIAKPCAWKRVEWLARMQVRPKDGKPLSAGDEHQIDADLAVVAEEVAAIIGRATGEPTPEGYVPLGPEKISLAKLPSTSPDLFGRESELATLDAAWESDETHVLSLVAWGGVGKTALVNRWLLEMGKEGYRGAERVYGWSFYSQGAAEGKQASADQFIDAALRWFGDPEPEAGTPWDKGERLAELVSRKRTLLVLDGLEPLQNPPPVETGRLKDPALSCLLRALARHNPGLVALTTRLAVDDLKDFAGTSAQRVDLEHLSVEAGAAYLKHLKVQGSREELEAAATEFDGHALALTLLGSYLAVGYGGDVRQRDKIARLTKEQQQGGHARRVMQAYERWFEGEPELNILYILGLFDRPAEAGAIEALRAGPVIAGLTDELAGLSGADWRYALDSLRRARLLVVDQPPEGLEPSGGYPPAGASEDTLDCHPLVREHFGERLQAEHPNAWRQAHSRLYEYYRDQALELPDTLAEMTPLFAAVVHGCQAGRHQEVLDEVYWPRISRGEEAYSVRKLGAFGADLAALSGFFEPPWRRPSAGLDEDWKAVVLTWAGFGLRALGRLRESAEPMQTALEAFIAQENWQEAAVNAGNLSELALARGDVAGALGYARQGVDFADRSRDAFLRMVLRTTLADALHQAGRLDEAEAAFREAEALQKKRQPEYPLLYSVRGYLYCDLLLGQGKYREVQERAERALEIVLQGSQNLLDIALNHLSLGRAYLAQALQEGTGDPSTALRTSYSQAAAHLEEAVNGLRKAGQQDELPRGLLARAALRRALGDFKRAEADLAEAASIAGRGGMRLFEADCHLEYARLYLAQGQPDQARQYLATAKAVIQETGYHRRDREVAELEGALNH